MIEALKRLGVSTIGLGTPYLDWVGQAEARFFADSGTESVSNHNLGIKDGHVIAALRPADVRDLALAVDTPEAEAIFLSCTDLPTYGIVSKLESLFGKPVVSSNTAGIWALLGSDTRLADLGRLFEAAGAVATR